MSNPHWSATGDDGVRKFEMLREIYEQPEAIQNTLKLYLDTETRTLREDLLESFANVLSSLTSITVIASGASRHAGLCGKVMIETLAGIRVHVEHASEFIYSKELISSPRTLVLAITQSGETADTVAALRVARQQQLPTLCISNVVDSTIAREADAALYTNAGTERAVPATKSFTSQLVVLYVFALLAAAARGRITPDQVATRTHTLHSIPQVISRVLQVFDERAKAIACEFEDGRPVILAGRGIHYPIALEAALKIKEISYIHAEAYPTGELRHGITALIDKEQPLIIFATRDQRDADSMLRFQKSVALIEELRKQSGSLILLVSDDDLRTRELSAMYFTIPEVDELLSPLLEIVPLQLLAYHIAVRKGFDVDHPRNLVKSVTVE
jgi:glucosamine--fructose-6-phosphate aminotransferase (isomerizing)